MKPHWTAVTIVLLVISFPVGTFAITSYEKRTQRSETNARIAAVEEEAVARAAAVAEASRLVDVKTCEAGNKFRADDLDTWQSVFALIHSPDQATIALLARIKKKDAPRNCAALTSPKG